MDEEAIRRMLEETSEDYSDSDSEFSADEIEDDYVSGKENWVFLFTKSCKSKAIIYLYYV